ncbi:MAG: acyl-CoA dehydrogenase family protein [Gammaproteobacteria bacterium]
MPDAAPLTEAALGLLPLLRAEAAGMEAQRRLSAPVLDALDALGAFHLQLDPRYGGPGADTLAYLQVIETLCRGDASSGWCAMVGSESSACLNAWFSADTVRDMLGTGPLARVALSAVGRGPAVICAGGHRVSGRWRFTSGCRHSQWLGALTVVHDDVTPRSTPQGAPQMRIVFVPTSAATLHDTWQTSGLRGTASDEFELADVFVPAAHGFDFGAPPLDPAPGWRVPLGLRLAMSKAAAVLGMAQGALDALPPLLERTPFAGAAPARDEPRTQAGLAEATAEVEAGRAYLQREVAAFCALVEAGGAPDAAARARTRLAIVHAARAALRAVDLARTLAGTGAVFDAGLDRAARDLAVARHHVQLQAHVMEDIGRVMLGQAARNPLF